jgi:hypothetical protein
MVGNGPKPWQEGLVRGRLEVSNVTECLHEGFLKNVLDANNPLEGGRKLPGDVLGQHCVVREKQLLQGYEIATCSPGGHLLL